MTSGNIQFDDPDNQLALEEVYLGEECNVLLKKFWQMKTARQNERGEEQFPHLKTFSALTDVTSDKKRSSLSSDSVSSLIAIKVAAKNRKETGRASEVTEELLSKMSTQILYRPSTKKKRGLTLHSSDKEVPQE